MRGALTKFSEGDVVDLARGHVPGARGCDLCKHLVDDRFTRPRSFQRQPQFLGVEGLGFAVGFLDVEGQWGIGCGHAANELILTGC